MHRLLVLLALLAACPRTDLYESFVSLSEPDPALFDEALIGRWELVGGPAPRHDIVVKRDGDRQYSAVISRPAKDGVIILRARLYATDVGGVYFMNVHLPDAVEIPDYDFAYLFRLYIDAGGRQVRARPVVAGGAGRNGLVRQYRTSAALRDAVRSRLDDPSLYGEEVVWRKGGS